MATGKGKSRKRRPKYKPDNPEQSARFIEEAKKLLGQDLDPEAFLRAVEALLKKDKRGSS